MAALVRFFGTLRNHWKKSTFATGAAIVGGYYLNDRHKANLLRAEFCKEAQLYGQKLTVIATEKPRKVTVFLNPAARKGKAAKLFEKNAAPLLHLAGINVEIIKTEYEGHAKDKAAELESTDAIVIAGGDGTVGEVITGLLRREDEKALSSRWPLAIIPVGASNTLAKVLYTDSESEVKWMCNAAMSVIKGPTKPVDVMAITDKDGREVFAVGDLKWGAFRDTKEKIPKYWYFGPLKNKLTYVFTTLGQTWSSNVTAHISYKPPVPDPEPEVVETPSVLWRWVSWFWRNRSKVEDEPVVQKDEDDDTEGWNELDITTRELLIATDNIQESSNKTLSSLNLITGPQEVSRMEFIREGWRRTSGKTSDQTTTDFPTETIEFGELKIEPVDTTKDKESWFGIDNEKFEADNIHIKLLRQKLHFFTNQQT